MIVDEVIVPAISSFEKKVLNCGDIWDTPLMHCDSLE
jgi:hypothetical protein